MSGASMIARTRSRLGAPRVRVSARMAAVARGLACAGLVLPGTVLMLALAAPLALLGLQIGLLANTPSWARGDAHDVQAVAARVLPLAGITVSLLLLPSVLLAIRRLAGLIRRLAGGWCGVPIADPYPSPGVEGMRIGFLARYRWLTEAATWRDALWLLVNLCVGWMLALAPALLVLFGLINLVPLPGSGRPPVTLAGPGGPHNALGWLRLPGLHPLIGNLVPNNQGLLGTFWGPAVLGIAFIALALWAAPRLLRGYGLLACALLRPTRQAELALRARDLARTRSEAIDAGAAEMRRIERDLHDGAQARLVAMGMTLDAASQMLTHNPAAAQALVLEARNSSARALAELRDLVRGIHPPVLADRGLADAVRALALDVPLRTSVACDLSGRLAAPVESAAYFAVNELLANVSKHACARQVWIDLRHGGGMLRIGVTDDGQGGADPAGGTGLRGIERRLAAFDGVLAISSPPGGPTAATMEIPCELLSSEAPSC